MIQAHAGPKSCPSVGPLNTQTHTRTFFTPVAPLSANGQVSGIFRRPQVEQFGSARYNSLLGPTYFASDASILKNFTLHEKLTFQLQAQAQNVFNHMNPGNPNSCIDCTVASGAGTISGLIGTAPTRQLNSPGACLSNQSSICAAYRRPFSRKRRGAAILAIRVTERSDGPSVHIASISEDGQQVPSSEGITVSAKTTRLDLTYAPLFLGSQRGIRFRYMLEGFDHGWIQAESAHLASYTNLQPGTFRFRVVAFDTTHPELKSEAAVNIIKQRYYYQTLWFRCGFVLLVLALFFSAIEFTCSELKRSSTPR